MRIAFLTGSLDPGRDGVGDYVRQLASELTAQGHTTFLASLRDRNAPATPLQAPGEIRTRNADEPAAAAALREALTTFRPDWNLWQYVPYSYGARGIVSAQTIATHRTLAAAAPAQAVFMHELWIGIPAASPLKDRAYGWLQRRATLRWMRALALRRVATSNAGYAAVLAHHGWPATVLPLAGSIPLAPLPPATPLSRADPRAPLRAGIFGTIHPQWQPETALRSLAAFARSQGRGLHCSTIGRPSAGGLARWREIAEALAGVAEFVEVGEQPTATVSQWFHGLDLGLSAMPFNLLGKSGTFAAMREHGLPVLITRDDWHLARLRLARPDFGPSVRLFSGESFDWAALLAARTTPALRGATLARETADLLAAGA